MIKKLIIVLILAALGTGAWFYWNQEETMELHFNSVKMQRGDFISRVQSTGTLEPVELVPVGAQVTGEILELGKDVAGNIVDYGSEVKAGQMLALVDDTLVELAIRSSEASVAQAKANIANAEATILRSKASLTQAKVTKANANRNLERAKKLGVGEALSQMSYDDYLSQSENADAALESAEAQLQGSYASLEQSKAQLASAESNLAREMRNREYTRIEAPVDGTIIVRQVNKGETVVSSMSTSVLFLVAHDLRKMEIWTSVNEVDIASIKPGQKVIYTVDAMPNEEFVGTVNKIRLNATMSSNVVTYIVEVDIENPERRLLPYMSSNVNFIVDEKKDVLMIPDAAFEYKPLPALIAESDADADAEGAAPAAGKGMGRGAGAGAGKGPKGKGAKGGDSKIATVWKRVEDDKVAPVRVLRGLSDGSRSIVTLLPNQELTEKDEIVTAARMVTPSADGKGGTNPFGMERPKRRERSTGK